MSSGGHWARVFMCVCVCVCVFSLVFFPPFFAPFLADGGPLRGALSAAQRALRLIGLLCRLAGPMPPGWHCTWPLLPVVLSGAWGAQAPRMMVQLLGGSGWWASALSVGATGTAPGPSCWLARPTVSSWHGRLSNGSYPLEGGILALGPFGPTDTAAVALPGSCPLPGGRGGQPGGKAGPWAGGPVLPSRS